MFVEMLAEALEEIGLANAIRDGRRGELVSKDIVMAILEEPR